MVLAKSSNDYDARVTHSYQSCRDVAARNNTAARNQSCSMNPPLLPTEEVSAPVESSPDPLALSFPAADIYMEGSPDPPSKTYIQCLRTLPLDQFRSEFRSDEVKRCQRCRNRCTVKSQSQSASQYTSRSQYISAGAPSRSPIDASSRTSTSLNGWAQAMACIEKEKCLAAAHKELARQIKNGTWRRIPRAKATRGRRPLTLRWVFKIKHDGTHLENKRLFRNKRLIPLSPIKSGP